MKMNQPAFGYIDDENLVRITGKFHGGVAVFLKNCANTISKPSGDKVFNYIFGDEKSLDYDTCSEVTGSGKECNDALVKYAAEGPMFKANYDFYLKRAMTLYNICLAVFMD
ncbi:hypothetical protein H0E87_028641 [Populus deltoides]|uniref:Prolamin-like domain-containing protein n=1 Tax=Populus deltoides TaxID=3696 RepID=A0A8T2WWC8_POPDE|nr:hypothetical protein H0E87_028641 [Populus deltoides]